MSQGTRLKTKWGYEREVPHCGNCKHYRSPKTVLIRSKPRTGPHMCVLGPFTVRPLGCCDCWVDRKTGETIETPIKVQKGKA